MLPTGNKCDSMSPRSAGENWQATKVGMPDFRDKALGVTIRPKAAPASSESVIHRYGMLRKVIETCCHAETSLTLRVRATVAPRNPKLLLRDARH